MTLKENSNTHLKIIYQIFHIKFFIFPFFSSFGKHLFQKNIFGAVFIFRLLLESLLLKRIIKNLSLAFCHLGLPNSRWTHVPSRITSFWLLRSILLHGRDRWNFFVRRVYFLPHRICSRLLGFYLNSCAHSLPINMMFIFGLICTLRFSLLH